MRNRKGFQNELREIQKPLVFLNSISFYDTEVNLARPFRRAQTCYAKRVHKKRATLRRLKQASRKKRTTKAARRDGLGAGSGDCVRKYGRCLERRTLFPEREPFVLCNPRP